MTRSPTETFFHPACSNGEMPLPRTRPLALTTNFIWVVGACFLALQIIPILVAVLATRLLH